MAEPLPFPYQRAGWETLLDDLADRVAERVSEHMLAQERSRPASERSSLLTAEEACEALKVSRSSLYRLVRAGQIRVCKVGRRNRYIAASVDAYVTTLAGSA